ncbi:peptidoglycan-associated lipoprotein Pal [Solemya velesiana gill symbiont]|uniref:Peptidoglycan-associated lipoprotein n=1 Tax=Solemya velesiana gill symbiont TaxID=1918948 RepID=A0A1T2KTG5_9GAMM|nr:peptidoglycan-associated lipoprotein Pal [Solemya velesiana gill symbiont]OOZ36112.1 peptidoglycan-associated lipoprotein [Solemya velesiana gill symbiont]
MKSRILKLVPVLALSLLFGGCATLTGEQAEEGAEDGAPVAEAGQGEGAQTAGAVEGGAWTGSPLDNPDSPLYSKVIYFDYDASEIRADYLDTVVAHGEYLAANPSATITVEGHCDERGSREYNIGLGERRANSVKRLLLAQGAAESQIITISYGEERPEALGSSDAAWAQNRRAVLLY